MQTRDSQPPPPADPTNKPSAEKRAWKGHLLRAGGIIAATALASIGGKVAETIITGMQSLRPQNELSVRRIPDNQFSPSSPITPFALIPSSTGNQPSDLANDSNSDKYTAALRRFGGIPASPLYLRMELRSPSGSKVLIRDIRAEIVSRTPSPAGWFVAEAGCGGEELRIGVLDLDAHAPRVSLNGFDSQDPQKQAPSLLSVSESEVEILEVHARSRKSDVLWRLRIFYSGPKGAGDLVLDDNGKPFRIAGTSGQQAWTWQFDPRTERQQPVRKPEWDREINVC